MSSAPAQIRPQAGPQEMFLSTSADIAFYGGAAGGGKSYGLLLEPFRHVGNGRFGAVLFRRTTPQLRATGGLVSESEELYQQVGARLNQSTLRWIFPSGATVTFAHMEHEKNRFDWQGSQIALIGFDELTHFTREQFLYMLSRNRSTCGVRPYVRATCNPVPKEDPVGGWVHQFLEWYIGEDGQAIPERGGVVRWFVVDSDAVVMADTRAELRQRFPALLPKSFTFVPAKVGDNPALLKADPNYLSNLMALPLIERERLLHGNWKVKAEAGKFFNRAWFRLVARLGDVPTTAEAEITDLCFWDFAATAKERTGHDPDYTAGCWMRRYRMGVHSVFVVMATIAYRLNPAEGERKFLATVERWAKQAGGKLLVRWEQEPGSAGKRETARLRGVLKNKGMGNVRGVPSQGDKLLRAQPLAIAAEDGDVYILDMGEERNEAWLAHMHHQPDWPHDDEMDAAAGAYNELLRVRKSNIS